MKLKEFVEKFVNHNALVRLWERDDETGGHSMLTRLARLSKDEVDMAWAILDGSSWQAKYAGYEVVDLPGIGIDRDTDAVNICIRKAEEPQEEPTRSDDKPQGFPAETVRAAILRNAETCVCGGRDQDYGKPENSFQAIADFWGHYLKAAHPKLDPVIAPNELVTPKDAAVMMALLKIARIAASDNPDSFVDLAGYAACAGELAALRGEQHG